MQSCDTWVMELTQLPMYCHMTAAKTYLCMAKRSRTRPATQAGPTDPLPHGSAGGGAGSPAALVSRKKNTKTKEPPPARCRARVDILSPGHTQPSPPP